MRIYQKRYQIVTQIQPKCPRNLTQKISNTLNVLENAPFSSIKILSHHSSLSPMLSDINYLNSFMFLVHITTELYK